MSGEVNQSIHFSNLKKYSENEWKPEKVLENSRSNKVQWLKQFFDLGFEKVVFMT